MTQNKKTSSDISSTKTFWTLNFIVLIVVAVYFLIGLNTCLNITLISIISYSFYINRNKKLSIYFTYIIILLVTLYPFTMILIKGGTLLNSNSIRSFFYKDDYIRIAILSILIQAACLSSFLFISSSKIIEQSKSILVKRNLTNYRLLLVPLLFISSVLSNPTSNIFASSYGSEGFSINYLHIGGWNILFIFIFSYYAIVTKLNTRLDFIICVSITFFWLAYGNRSEVFFIIPLYIIFNSTSKITLSNKFKYAIFIILAIILFQVIGHVRTKSNLSILDVFDASNYSLEIFRHQDRLTINTVDATDYALLSLIGLIESRTYNLQYGRTYFDYLFRTLPSFIVKERPEDIAVKIMRDASAIGGVHFAGEGFLNFHLAGVFLQAFMVGSILLWFEKKATKNPLFLLTYLSLWMLSARIILYGNIYLYKSLVLFVVLLIMSFFIKSININRYQKHVNCLSITLIHNR